MTTAFVWYWSKAVEVSMLLAVAAAAPALAAAAADPAGATGPAVTAERPAIQPQTAPVACGDKMTDAERDAYGRRIAAAATPEERAKIWAVYVIALNQTTPEQPLVGNPARGASLHRGCFGCHGIERYVAPVTNMAASFVDSLLRASGLSDLPPPTRFKGRITSLAALRDAVSRRNDLLNPKMSPQELADLVAYLNAEYYKFPQ